MKAPITFKIIVSYDGTDYYGWQYQPDRQTIAGVLQARFHAVFNKEIWLIAASRTDAGVHALGQVATFTIDFDIDPEKLIKAWNSLLPDSIVILSCERVDDFHPQRKVTRKIYHYTLYTQRPLPFKSRYGWLVYKPINLEKLRDCLQVFVGTHDFRSFCSIDEPKSTLRTVESLELVYDTTLKTGTIIVKGPGFLRYMIRRIVGGCVKVASTRHLTQDDLVAALHAKNPEQNIFTAPAKGLLLYSIDYEES